MATTTTFLGALASSASSHAPIGARFALDMQYRSSRAVNQDPAQVAEWAMAGGSTLLALPFESERNIGLF
jgi:hypothetical protein